MILSPSESPLSTIILEWKELSSHRRLRIPKQFYYFLSYSIFWSLKPLGSAIARFRSCTILLCQRLKHKYLCTFERSASVYFKRWISVVAPIRMMLPFHKGKKCVLLSLIEPVYLIHENYSLFTVAAVSFACCITARISFIPAGRQKSL